MVRKCVAAVHKATGKAFSEPEIDELLDRLVARAARLGKDGEPGADAQARVRAAAAELSRGQVMDLMVRRRMEMAAEISRDFRRTRLDAMRGSEAEKLKAFDVGSERQGPFSGASTDAEGRGKSMTLWGRVELGLKKIPGAKTRLSNFWGVGEKGFDRLVAREMARLNGAGHIDPTGDEAALAVAKVFNAAIELGRAWQNDAGAYIGKLEGYVAKQSHDRLRVAGGFWRELGEVGRRLKAGEGLKAVDWEAAKTRAAMRAFSEWRDFIKPKLDAKTFDNLAEGDVAGPLDPVRDPLGPNASIEDRMLYRVWFDIVTGKHEQLAGMNDVADFRPPPSKARAVSKARVLHFKDPDAWIDYNNRYGRGSLFSAVMSQLDRAGRNTALMERWGPAPEAARSAEIERLSSQARQRGDPDAAAALNKRSTQAAFDEVTGALNAPENLRLAIVARTIRTYESLAKLGSMVLSKTTDLPMASHAMARAGVGFLKGYEGTLKGVSGLQGAEAREAADLLHAGARSFAGHLTGQFSPTDGPLGWASWASRLHYRINLFEFVNEGVRRGAAEMLARHLAEEADKPFAGLKAGTRETFERFGIDEGAWELARHGLEPAQDGAKYFTLDHISQIPDEAVHAWAGHEGEAATPQAADRGRQDLEMRFRTLVHNVLDDTTSEPRAREHAATSFGLKPGTVFGEAARAFSQFHGFIRTILGRHLVPAANGYAGMAPAALLAHFIAGTILAGYFAMQAKLISRGELPRKLTNPDGSPNLRLWGAALAQGGGLGIYGDYLFGERNRQGLGFTLSAFAGPAVSDMEQVAQIVRASVQANLFGDDAQKTQINGQMPGELTQFASSHVPLINLFYTRLALDYLVLWRLQEAASPGHLQRLEDRVRRQEGSDFWLQPTSALQ